MSNVRDFAEHITDNQKKKPNKAQIDKLFTAVKTELQSVEPDYDGCVLALTMFPPQILGAFYEEIYTHSPADVCALFDSAFLAWAKGRPKIAGGNLAYIKMAQVIKKRLAIVSSADNLSPELQWYISNFDDSRAARETKKIRDECELTDLQKLLALDIQDWNINTEMLKKFYGILFADFTGPITKNMYQAFLSRNHLVSELPSDPAVSLSHIMDASNEQSEISTATVTSSNSVPKGMPADISQPCESPLTIPQQDPTESDLAKNGVKLAELLLAWSRKQTTGVTALRESLRRSGKEYRQLETQLSNMREELLTVKKELADRDAAIASLQQRLAETTANLDLSQKQVAELDETILKLQRMNENSASQAVFGYKAELASSLKSIVEDASLPEAQEDASILFALLGDLLDTLRFRGVPLEGK